MTVTTQPSLSILETPYQEQFLIVPIFFKKQIESIIAASTPGYVFGFFYGEQRENYRIIKKIWPVTSAGNDENQIFITARDFEAAKNLESGESLRLLGCFYSTENGKVRKALLSDSQIDSFSFVELKGGTNHTCIWKSSLTNPGSSRLIDQKVIL